MDWSKLSEIGTNNDINQYIIDNDFTRLEADPCKYVKKIEINNNGIITIYIT